MAKVMMPITQAKTNADPTTGQSDIDANLALLAGLIENGRLKVNAAGVTLTVDNLEFDVSELATAQKQDDVMDILGGLTDEPLAGETAEGATARTGISLKKRIVNKLIEIKALFTAGSKAMAASLPVTIATDDTVLGGTAADVVDAGAVGSVSAKLRRLTTDMGAVSAVDNRTTLAITEITVTAASATLAALLTAASGAINASVKRVKLKPAADIYAAIGGAASATTVPFVTANNEREVFMDASTDLRLIAGGNVACQVIQEG